MYYCHIDRLSLYNCVNKGYKHTSRYLKNNLGKKFQKKNV